MFMHLMGERNETYRLGCILISRLSFIGQRIHHPQPVAVHKLNHAFRLQPHQPIETSFSVYFLPNIKGIPIAIMSTGWSGVALMSRGTSRIPSLALLVAGYIAIEDVGIVFGTR